MNLQEQTKVRIIIVDRTSIIYKYNNLIATILRSFNKACEVEINTGGHIDTIVLNNIYLFNLTEGKLILPSNNHTTLLSLL